MGLVVATETVKYWAVMATSPGDARVVREFPSEMKRLIFFSVGFEDEANNVLQDPYKGHRHLAVHTDKGLILACMRATVICASTIYAQCLFV